MSIEDNFTRLAHLYARHRPQYPPALFARLASLAPGRDLAWDCGTGNGQAAVGLAEYFAHVVGTDASLGQIQNALPHPRVTYRVAQAEQSGLDSGMVDVVTCAQSIHWFDLDLFYPEVRRALKPRGLLAAWCYHAPEITPEIDRIVISYYYDVVGPYWSPGIRLVEEHYQTIPFPFHEIEPPLLGMETSWALDDLIGYMNSWSSTIRFREVRGYDPVDEIRAGLTRAWGTDASLKRRVWLRLYFRIGYRP